LEAVVVAMLAMVVKDLVARARAAIWAMALVLQTMAQTQVVLLRLTRVLVVVEPEV
jgi:hypothetical protein